MGGPSQDETFDGIRREQARRRAAVGRHAHLVQDVSATLYRFDPIGLADGGNLDAYDFEAEMIQENLFGGVAGVAAVQALVHRVLVEQFDADLAGAPGDHAALAAEIWGLWAEAYGVDSGGP
jgi:hypothetical protein